MTRAPRWPLLLSVLVLTACGTASPAVRAWNAAEHLGACGARGADRCVIFACAGDTAECGFYGCEDMLPDEAVVGTEELSEQPGPLLASRGGVFVRAPFLPRHLRNRRMGLRGDAEPILVFAMYRTPEVVRPLPLPAGRFVKHHIFPQAAEFRPFFTAAGINIHDFTMPIPQHIHFRIHGGGPSGGQWNQAWRSFVQGRLGRRTPAEEIYKHAGVLIHRFDLMGRIEPYYSR
ncbi:TIGR02269 family lipoprotein [Pyxidicoccus trucidator]|uniref:SitA6 family polymorphic toxin lipoprotein n=1 Tax=Pyxidicoccus trucidator TaxID=2709662 RepID=UPI001F077801|nr:TIGR02269 family lipoprotein [Pyxidicoccus trucidator]